MRFNFKPYKLWILFLATFFAYGFKSGEVLVSQSGSRYQLIEVLGEGYFSQVWRSRDLASGQLFAVKVYKPSVDEGRILTDKGTYEDFLYSVEPARTPHILRYFHPEMVTSESYPEKKMLIFRSELASKTVKQLAPTAFFIDLDDQGTIEKKLRNLMTLIGHMVSGVYELAEFGFRHNDITPNNVIFEDGYFKLADLASLTGLKEKPRSTADWELSYAPPEFSSGDPMMLSPESDLYSVGAVAFWALTGSNALTNLVDIVAEDVRKKHGGFFNTSGRPDRRSSIEEKKKYWEFFDSVRRELGKNQIVQEFYYKSIEVRLNTLLIDIQGSVNKEFYMRNVIPLTDLIKIFLIPNPKDRNKMIEEFKADPLRNHLLKHTLSTDSRAACDQAWAF